MSNSNTCAAVEPRPWYVSVTVVWKELGNFPALRDAIWPFLRRRRLPAHHVAVPCDSWHSTVFAVLRINRVPPEYDTFGDFANQLFKRLRRYPSLKQGLARRLKPLKLVAKEFRCHDDGTTVQFRKNDDLKRLRINLRKFFRPHVNRLIGSMVSADGTPPVVESLLDHREKSSGNKLYGSFVRSPSRADSSVLRWKKPIRPIVRLRCNRFHLLVSDDALTNPRQPDVNDLLFIR